MKTRAMIIGFYLMAAASFFPMVVGVSIFVDLVRYHRFKHYHITDFLRYVVISLLLGCIPFASISFKGWQERR